VLGRCGLQPASRGEYAEWVAGRKAGAATAAGAAGAAEAPPCA
jgi:hypothetical protein